MEDRVNNILAACHVTGNYTNNKALYMGNHILFLMYVTPFITRKNDSFRSCTDKYTQKRNGDCARIATPCSHFLNSSPNMLSVFYLTNIVSLNITFSFISQYKYGELNPRKVKRLTGKCDNCKHCTS